MVASTAARAVIGRALVGLMPAARSPRFLSTGVRSISWQTVHTHSRMWLRGVRGMSGSGGAGAKIKGPVTWQSVGLLVCVGGGLVVYFNSVEQDRLQRQQETKLGKSVGKMRRHHLRISYLRRESTAS